jgi:hypothetical protein
MCARHSRRTHDNTRRADSRAATDELPRSDASRLGARVSLQAAGSEGSGGAKSTPQVSWRHCAHCGSTLTPLRKFGVTVPFWVLSQTW